MPHRVPRSVRNLRPDVRLPVKPIVTEVLRKAPLFLHAPILNSLSSPFSIGNASRIKQTVCRLMHESAGVPRHRVGGIVLKMEVGEAHVASGQDMVVTGDSAVAKHYCSDEPLHAAEPSRVDFGEEIQGHLGLGHKQWVFLCFGANVGNDDAAMLRERIVRREEHTPHDPVQRVQRDVDHFAKIVCDDSSVHSFLSTSPSAPSDGAAIRCGYMVSKCLNRKMTICSEKISLVLRRVCD